MVVAVVSMGEDSVAVFMAAASTLAVLQAESACAAAESASFLERVFGGSLQPMLAHFMEGKKLSAEEIRELKRILDRK